MRKKLVILGLCVAVGLCQIPLLSHAQEERYNYTVHFESTSDMIGGLDNTGGGWSTLAGSTGIVTDGYAGSMARFTFATKVGGSATSASSYGFRFPTWSNSTTYLGDDAWSPVPGKKQSFAQALADSEAVSFFIKTPACDYERTAAFKIETKPDKSGGTSKSYQTDYISLPTDGEWHLMQIPLEQFISGEELFSSLTPEMLKTDHIPYKFAAVFTYQSYLNIDTVPVSDTEIQQSMLYLDELMFERDTSSSYPIAIPASASDEYYTNADLLSVSIGGIRTAITQDTQTVAVPYGTTVDDLNENTVIATLKCPTVYTIPEQNLQYRSGAVSRIDYPESMDQPLCIEVTAASGIVKKYQLSMEEKTFYVAIEDLSVNDGAGLLTGENTIQFHVSYYGKEAMPLSFFAIARKNDSGMRAAADYHHISSMQNGSSEMVTMQFVLPQDVENHTVTLYSFDSLSSLRMVTEVIEVTAN